MLYAQEYRKNMHHTQHSSNFTHEVAPIVTQQLVKHMEQSIIVVPTYRSTITTLNVESDAVNVVDHLIQTIYK